MDFFLLESAVDLRLRHWGLKKKFRNAWESFKLHSQPHIGLTSKLFLLSGVFYNVLVEFSHVTHWDTGVHGDNIEIQIHRSV